MNKNLIIWDSDSLCYLGKAEDSLAEIVEKVDCKIQEVLTETKADYYVLLVSKGKYFRHDISKSKEDEGGTYKANRKYSNKNWVRTIKEYLISKYGAVYYPKLEADDIASFLMSQELRVNVMKDESIIIDNNTPDSDQIASTIEINKTLVAIDKDLIKSIPGKHLIPSKKLPSGEWGMDWIETSIDESALYEWEAMVCGDTSDGIRGLNRKGQAWCDKNFTGKSLREVHLLVFDEYVKEHKDISKAIFEFQKNWRLLHMLNTSQDFMREVGYVPELPEFQEVIKPEQTKKVEF